jgi:hypothetical protein
MLGRAKPGQAEVKFETGKTLTRQFENVQRTQQEFWKRWVEEVFPERLKQSKWKQDRRDLKVGDIVLRKDETAAGQTYKYAKVVKVHISADGKVRAADIEYKLPGESVFRTTTRPIHKLVLVVPVEEQVTAVGQAEQPADPGSSRARACAAGGGQGYRGSPTGNEGARSNTPGGEWGHGSGRGSPRGCAPNRPGETRGAEGGSEVQKSDFPEEGRKAGANNHCVGAKRGRRNGGCQSETKEERETEEDPWHGSTGSAQGECLGSW